MGYLRFCSEFGVGPVRPGEDRQTARPGRPRAAEGVNQERKYSSPHAHEVKGKAKQAAGQVTNNPDLETEGRVEKLTGKIQKKVGQVEKALEK